jgi:hypothetical protein
MLHIGATKRQEKPQISANWQKSTGFGKIGGAEVVSISHFNRLK